jgi:hypothetical protein
MDKIEITGIQILQTVGPDVVILDTSLPCGTWPYENTAVLRMDVAADKGEDYVKENFRDTKYEVIDAGRTNQRG